MEVTNGLNLIKKNTPTSKYPAPKVLSEDSRPL